MIWDEVHEKFYRVFQASEARRLKVLPGRINKSGKLSAVLVETTYRKEGEASRMFVTPIGVLLGRGLVMADGLGLTQECEDLFDELLMHLRCKAHDGRFYATKSGRTMVAFTQRGGGAETSRPLLMLP